MAPPRRVTLSPRVTPWHRTPIPGTILAVPKPGWEQREPAWARGRAGSTVLAQEQAAVAGHQQC